MTQPLNKKIFLKLIKEIKSLLPEMEELLFQLTAEESDITQATTKLRSHSSTIMGVASMASLDELTNTATLINGVIDDIMEGKMTWSPQLIDFITETIPHINTYCSSLETKQNVESKLYQTTLSAFDEFKNLYANSVNDDEDSDDEDFDVEDFEDGDSFEDLDLDFFGEDEDEPEPDSPKEILEDSPPDVPSKMADIDPEFLESFNEESIDHLNNIGQKLNLLAPSITDRTDISDGSREMLHSVRRSVHTLKGAAAVIGIKTVAKFGNDFEDFLDWLHDESDSLSPEIIEAMLDGADILEKLSINPVINIDTEIDEMNSVFNAIMTNSSAAVLNKEQIHSVDDDSKPKNELESIDEPIDQTTDQPIDQFEVEQVETLKTPIENDEASETSWMNDIDPEFLKSFNEESKDHLNNIGRQLNLLSSFINQKTDIFDGYREILHSTRGSVHTLKSAAAVIGIKPVVNFGNELKDFLDWLHDESDILSPEIIKAMLDGADILEKLAVNPEIKIDTEIDEINAVFNAIITDASNAVLNKEQIPSVDVDEKQKIEFESIVEPSDQPTDQPEVESVNDEASDDEDLFEDLDIDIFDEDEPDSQKEKLEEDLFRQLSIDEGRDDIPSKIDSSQMTDIDPEFLESFNEESKDHLNNIGEKLNLLSPLINDKTDINDEYRETLHSIRRSIHTLKGAAAVIGIKSVASFGNEFEDFLDWLHDESDSLSPVIITAMLDGTDLLEILSVNPETEIDKEIAEMNSVFKAIIADSSEAVLNKKQKTPDLPIDQPEVEQIKISKSLRVDMGKVDQMIGLIGDMTINLSSHDDSSEFLQTTLNEFDNTMKRLTDITLNLETGFELATIPHLNAVTGSVQKENENMDEFDPLEMDRYSDLHVMIRSLKEAVTDLNSIMDQTSKAQNLWRSIMGRQRNVVAEIQNSMQLIKMTPFSTLANRLHKTVRESARATAKSVRLVLEESTTEMDTHVWNVLADPLMHLLRNSIDHGIESPDERKKSKKPNQGTILIRCIRRGSWMNIHFSDDGKGLDYIAIRNRASKLYPKTDVSAMDNSELTSLIFKHGFTIKTKATTISGRGVGMDVVDHAVKQLNGSIEVISIPDKGTEFILRLPIEVAQLPALLVNFGQQEFAVPLRDINRVFKISHKQSIKNDCELDNIVLPLLRPAEIMGLKPMIEPVDKNPFALSVDVGNENGVLVTDAIIGKRNVIFKSLGSHLHNQVPCIAGATIMGNGSLIPIINTEELFSRQKSSVQLVESADLKTDINKQDLKILIVDDSISIRKVLTNFISNQGWQPSVAKDGVDAMEMIRQHSFDLILLDIEMPRMNGFDVLQSLQLHLDYNDIPVLMLTSRSAKKHRDRATELGARGFVTKPFQDDELLSLINGLIKPALSNNKLKTGN